MQQHPFIFSDELRYRVQRHAAFWTFWWIFQGFLYSFVNTQASQSYIVNLELSMLDSFVFMLQHMFLAYTLMYFVVPRFLLRQRYIATGAITVLVFIVTAFMSMLLARWVVNPLHVYLVTLGLLPNQCLFSQVNMFYALLAGLRGGITIGGIAAAIKLMKYWYVKEQRNLQLQKENVESQLQLLKAQVHPHFLFNTLNNIYSHTQDKAPVAAHLISGLSDILRFILYESTQTLVPLSKEITMMQDYISLEQIRYGNKLDLHVDVPQHTQDLYIAPLLLLPLIENCFKHGASTMLDQPWISLQITLEGKQMHMKLLNGKTNDSSHDDQPSGIGVQNVRKRLELLYPGRHELAIDNEEDVFIVNLTLSLEQIRQRKTKFVHLAEPAHA